MGLALARAVIGRDWGGVPDPRRGGFWQPDHLRPRHLCPKKHLSPAGPAPDLGDHLGSPPAGIALRFDPGDLGCADDLLAVTCLAGSALRSQSYRLPPDQSGDQSGSQNLWVAADQPVGSGFPAAGDFSFGISRLPAGLNRVLALCLPHFSGPLRGVGPLLSQGPL